MSSTLTNTSAMTALATLRNINSSLNKTMDEISTGKSVASAKDNAAVWAISKTMESDVQGFMAISDSLALGEETVAVARKAAGTITDLLTQMKNKVIAAQGGNDADRAKLQIDVVALRDQIESVVAAAQFNGLNLVDGTETSIEVLSSLDRSGSTVTSADITVNGEDLSVGGYTAKVAFTGTGVSTAGDTLAITLDNGGGTGNVTIADPTYEAGDSISIRIGNQMVTYTVSASDLAATSVEDMVAVGLKNAIDALGIADLVVNYDIATPGQLAFTNNGAVDLAVSGQFENTGSGGLGALAAIDISTDVGADAALGSIETLIQTAISASSELGSSEKRIEIQAEFILGLTDSLKSGIGTLVDADMEEASARLQALQVQQQLGIQSLSIANQAPQSILSLFR